LTYTADPVATCPERRIERVYLEVGRTAYRGVAMIDAAPLISEAKPVLGLYTDPRGAAELMLELARLARGADRVTDLPTPPLADG
jgi:hypothetical protein